MVTRQGRRLAAAVTALTGAVSLIMLVIGLAPGAASAATTGGNPTRTSVVQHATFAAPAVSPKCQEVGSNSVVADYVDHELLAVDATYSFVVSCPKGVARIMGDQAYEYFNGVEANKGNKASCTGCDKLNSHGRAICDAGVACAGLYQIHAVWVIGLTSKYKWGKVPSYCTVTQSRHYVTCRVTSAGVRVPAVH